MAVACGDKNWHLFEAAIHDLKLLASELRVAAEHLKSLRFDSRHVHLYVVEFSI